MKATDARDPTLRSLEHAGIVLTEAERTAREGLGIRLGDLTMPVRDMSGGQRQAIASPRRPAGTKSFD